MLRNTGVLASGPGVLSEDSGVLTDSGRSEAAASRGQTRGVLAVEAVADSHEHPTGFRCLWLTWDLAPQRCRHNDGHMSSRLSSVNPLGRSSAPSVCWRNEARARADPQAVCSAHVVGRARPVLGATQ